MIADTSFVIDLLRKRSVSAVDKLFELENAGEPLFVTSVSVFELWRGAAFAENREEGHKIVEFVSKSSVVPLDEYAARKAGLISGSLLRGGMPIEPEDCMIAGVALTNNQALITKNTKHFSRITGLKLETY